MATPEIENLFGNLSLSSYSYLDCRCGLTIRALCNTTLRIYGEEVQCISCGHWEHVACQRYGRASKLLAGENNDFTCDHCNFNHMFPRLKEMELRPGRGALARHGEYFYPVRLIQKVSMTRWTVRWWRGNCFVAASVQAGEVSVVNEEDLIDSLWLDRARRREVRLGRWSHATDVETSEDILSDPSSVPYPDEIDAVLSPHKDTLQKLVAHDYARIQDSLVPVLKWARETKKSLKSSIVPYVGNLTITQRAQLSNWFDIHITGKDPKQRLEWLGRLPFAHAITLYIAHQISQDGDNTPGKNTHRLKAAWDIQLTRISSRLLDIDVDAESLYLLEADMFEVSVEASVAGYFQWGLDVGHHQDNWSPYARLSHFRVGDYSLDDGFIEQGPNYIHYVSPKQTEMRKPRPKPRPKHKQL
ncbi:hypothetical protein BJ165DRAFT_1351680 [Panaeolus papilionaceus]|nr:hypothetical protein BJ165DRAFT_1351680 [Panaeolus papilionaceus]